MSGIFNKNPKSNDAVRRTINGLSFRLEVPKTIHIIEIKILKKGKIIQSKIENSQISNYYKSNIIRNSINYY